MSADSFHHQVEQEAQKQGYIYVFNDFLSICENVGKVLCMEPRDFYAYTNELSQGVQSKNSRPYLHQVVIAEFRRGSLGLFFKKGHKESIYEFTPFIKKQFIKDIENGTLKYKASSYPGISADRKQGIIDTLLELMPESRRQFWLKLKSYQKEHE